MLKINKNFYYNLLFWGGAIIALITINIQLITMNHIVSNGRTVLVPLYFSEQADFADEGYMKIRYENIIPDTSFNNKNGKIVISSDINKVAIYSRFLDSQMPVEIGEFLLDYKINRPYGFFKTDGVVRISFGPERFKIKKDVFLGHYMRSRYAILKVSDNGESVLYGLADMNYQELVRFF